MHDDEQPPDTLRGAFTRLRRGDVPNDIESAVLANARAHWARRRRMRWIVGAGASLAAASVLALAFIAFEHGAQKLEIESACAEDIDHNGRVDILDAFALARSIAHDPPNDPKLDFTHDGRVDRADVDHVAEIAVRLGS